MASSINKARKIYESLKVNMKRLAKGEDLDRSVMRRSIVCTREIPEGKIIGWDDIGFKRPGTGLPPSFAEMVIGRKALKDIRVDELITKEMFN